MSRDMRERYWLVHPNGGRQLIDPRQFDLDRLAESARAVGGRLVVEADTRLGLPETELEFGRPMETDPDADADADTDSEPGPASTSSTSASNSARPPLRFEPPISALSPLFRNRFERVYAAIEGYELEINTRPTTRVLGGYYKSRRLVRVYSHDRQLGRRPMEELFDTFLHEMAHHIEYTEPDSFHARGCERVPGRMHSRLFWLILGDLKARWAELQQPG